MRYGTVKYTRGHESVTTAGKGMWTRLKSDWQQMMEYAKGDGPQSVDSTILRTTDRGRTLPIVVGNISTIIEL